MFRFSLTRALSAISLSLLVLLLWNLYKNQLPNYQRTCNATAEYQTELETLLKRWAYAFYRRKCRIGLLLNFVYIFF